MWSAFLDPRAEWATAEFAAWCEPRDIRIILTANEPGPQCAGLAYHCTDGVPPQTRALYTALLDAGLIKQIPLTGSLIHLAKQGVMLLNRVLNPKFRAESIQWTRDLIYRLTVAHQCILVIDSMGDLRGPAILPMTGAGLLAANTALHNWGFPRIVYDMQSEVERGLNMQGITSVCFTDGSCFPNKKVPAACGGYAVRFVLGNLADTVLYGNIQNRPLYATNQRAEGEAIHAALKYAWLRADEFENLIICTDSQFWISMFTQYMPRWTADKFATMQNSDMTIPLNTLYKKIAARHGVRFIHIPAHDSLGWSRAPAGSYHLFCYTHNDFVDRKATYARVHLQPGTDTVEIDGQTVDI